MLLEQYTFIVKEVSDLVSKQIPMTIHTHLQILQKLKDFQNNNSQTSLSHSKVEKKSQQKKQIIRKKWESYHRLEDVTMDATFSIYLQCHKLHVKKTAYEHKKPSNLQSYRERLYNNESIIDIAKSINFPPYMLIRYLINYGNLLGNDKRKKIIGTAGHDIEDPIIRKAVQQAAALDLYYSPAADVVRLNAGIEYEIILQQKLHDLKIAFQSEDQMRSEGRSKTPDIRLIVPIAIVKGDRSHLLTSSSSSPSLLKSSKSPSNSAPATLGSSLTNISTPSSSFHIINWIDSKAMFGDPTTHNDNKKQLQGYVNRYGPGMVIYWFDFVNELVNNDVDDILICKDFPLEYIQAFKHVKTQDEVPCNF